MNSNNIKALLVFSLGNFCVFITIFKTLYVDMPSEIFVYESLMSYVFLAVSEYKISVELSSFNCRYVLYILLSSVFFLPFWLFAYINDLSIKDIVVYGSYVSVIIIPILLITRWKLLYLFKMPNERKEVAKALFTSVVLDVVYAITKRMIGYNICVSMSLVFYSVVLPIGYTSKCVLCLILKMNNK